MIQIHKNYLTREECSLIINYYNNNTNKVFKESNVYVKNYEGIEIDTTSDFILKSKFNMKLAENIRIQKTNLNVIPTTLLHTHTTPYNFIIFLNSNYEGGNLYIGNEYVKPETGTMIYFTGDEKHYPTPVPIGERYVIACFLTKDIFANKKVLI